jgi:hypothetical protein
LSVWKVITIAAVPLSLDIHGKVRSFTAVTIICKAKQGILVFPDCVWVYDGVVAKALSTEQEDYTCDEEERRAREWRGGRETKGK